MLTGNYYFGDMFRLDPSETIAVVYERGRLLKRYTVADVLARNPEEVALERKLDIIGGGWVPLTSFVSSAVPDWLNRRITVRMWDGSDHQLTL